MSHIMKIYLSLLLCAILSIATLPSVQAASQSTMQIKADISDADFWAYNFINDSIQSKAASVKVEWSTGNVGNNLKEETIINAGKTSGQVAIISNKGEAVNVKIIVKNARNNTLGSWSLQIPNKGQTETITIVLPEMVKPEFIRNSNN